jgi:rhodanese-related sulfurtransferase
MKRSIFLFLFVVVLEGCSQSQNITLLDVNQFESHLHDKTDKIVLDVRTPDEYAAGHIAGAQLLDYYRSDFKTQVAKLDKNKPVYVYCASGGRSSSAAKILAQTGFTRVYDLRGGINAWRKAGKPVQQ